MEKVRRDLTEDGFMERYTVADYSEAFRTMNIRRRKDVLEARRTDCVCIEALGRMIPKPPGTVRRETLTGGDEEGAYGIFTEQWVCPNKGCNHQVSEGQRFCQECGQAINWH